MVKDPRKTSRLGTIRPLNLPAPVVVEEDEHQRPVSITLRRRRLKVASIDDVWEIVDEWWRAEPIARMYYKVTAQEIGAITIYRDLESGGWYHQRG